MPMSVKQKKLKKKIPCEDVKEFEITITPEGRVIFSEWHKDFIDFAEAVRYDAPHLIPLVGSRIYCG